MGTLDGDSKMTKGEYIARYGLEAYEERKRKMREYKQANKEQLSKYNKKWYQANKERILEEHKEYYQANKEQISEYQKEYQKLNKERILEQMKEYRQANKERISEYIKEYRSTPIGRATNIVNANNHKDRAKGFDISNNVDRLWVVENIFSGQKCIYCGDSDWTHLGCDRIDNAKPHTPDNVVCCCSECNEERSDKFTVEEFKSYRAIKPKTTPVRI